MRFAMLLLMLSLISLNCVTLQEFDDQRHFVNCHYKIIGVRDIVYNPQEDYDRMTIILEVAIQNPNREIEVMLNQLQVAAFVNGETVTNTTINVRHNVPASGESVAAVPFDISVRTVGRELINTIQTQGVDYRLSGKAILSTSVGDYSFPVTIQEGFWSE